MPGGVAAKDVVSWYQREIPEGTPWKGMPECTSDEGSNAPSIVEDGPPSQLWRVWSDGTRNLQLEIIESAGKLQIQIASDAGPMSAC
jgi:hypothetical protein